MSHARTSDPIEHQAAPSEMTRSTTAGEVTGSTSAGARSPFIDHIAPLKRDMAYDSRRAKAALPVEVHFRDGSITTANLVLDADQMSMVFVQLERAIDKRDRIGT